MVRSRAAFSVHQPFADQILRGTKKYEYRTIPTRIRGRVYVYATFKRLCRRRAHLPRGRILGTVEVIACEWSPRLCCYRWKLSHPRRIRPRLPHNHPQPVWFYPFQAKTNSIAKTQRMKINFLLRVSASLRLRDAFSSPQSPSCGHAPGHRDIPSKSHPSPAS